MFISIKKSILVCGILASCICLSAAYAHARGKGSSSGYKTYKGAKAIDGDTYKYKGQRYRLRDYNAPEIGQTGSGKATQKLQRKLSSGNYEYKRVAKDVYGRPVVKERKKNK
jgi:endonuclease YncB( thermonuclease family)